MPLYEYQCEACSHRFEVIQKFSDAHLDTCPKCGGVVRKLLSSPAFHFKGSGWYITDYARAGKTGDEGGGEKSGSKGDKGSGADVKPDSKGDSKADAKGESKAEAKTESSSEPKSDAKPSSTSDSKAS
jgi:putative FmdB family regulatory protein